MYIEQRIDQLESITADLIKGQDSIARGLGILTVDTLSRFDRVDRNLQQLREDLADVKQQGVRNADNIDGLHERLNQLDRKIESEIGSLRGEMLRRFEQVDARFEQVDARFEQVDARFERVETEISTLRGDMNARFEAVDARFEAIDRRFDELEQRLNDKIDSKIDGLRTEMNHKFDVIIKLLQK